MTKRPQDETPPPYRLPDAAPSAADIDNRDRWNALVDESLKSAQEAAEKWRTGLAAFVALVTGGLLLKGPTEAQDLSVRWRLAVTVLAIGGLVAAMVGLWLALRAAAGTPANLNLPRVVAQYGGVAEFMVVSAQKAANYLRFAKLLVAVALTLLVSGVTLWWWAPPVGGEPPAYLRVDFAEENACGKLLSADRRRLRLAVEGESVPRSIPLADVENLRILPSCAD